MHYFDIFPHCFCIFDIDNANTIYNTSLYMEKGLIFILLELGHINGWLKNMGHLYFSFKEIEIFILSTNSFFPFFIFVFKSRGFW